MKLELVLIIVASLFAKSVQEGQQCMNDLNFIIQHQGTKSMVSLTCKQIRNQVEGNRIELCKKDDVRKSCPQACGLCCEDDSTYKFQTNHDPADKNCAWLSDKQIRPVTHCEEKNSSGQSVSDGCPSTCKVCKPYVDNTEIPDYVVEALKEEDKASSSPSISSPPTSSPAPTMATCVDNQKFKFKKKHRCRDIRKEEYRRQSLCQHEHVRKECPATCGLCCKDDDTYLFKNSDDEEKGCSSLEGSEIKATRYCDRFQNGQMVRNACQKSCDHCHSKVLILEKGGKTDEEEVKDNKKNQPEDKRPTIGGPAAVTTAEGRSRWRSRTFLALTVVFISIGVLLLVSKVYTSTTKEKLTKEERLEMQRKSNRHMLDIEENGPKPQSEIIVKEKVSVESKVTDEVVTIPSVMTEQSGQSFIQLTMSNLGNKRTTQTDVHRCTNFPCVQCAKDQDITFIKAPRTNIERDEEGRIEFVPVPVSYIGKELTHEIKPLDTLSISTESEIGDSGSTFNSSFSRDGARSRDRYSSRSSHSDNYGDSNKPDKYDQEMESIQEHSHSSMLQTEKEV